MTTLLCQTLVSELSQEYEFTRSDRLHVGSIVPYLLFVNVPAGTFTFSVTGPNGVVISKDFTSTEVKTALGTPSDYFHVYYPIISDNPVQIEAGVYTFTLSATGYSPTIDSYIAWIQQHENIQNEFSYIPLGDNQNPFTIRFKELKEGII